jgi:hypothetical protein
MNMGLVPRSQDKSLCPAYNGVVHLLFLILWWLLPVATSATPCGDFGDLKMDGPGNPLSAQTVACLEDTIKDGDPIARSQASFVLIVHAHSQGDQTRGALMKRHLTELHTTDAEVAYLYARYLWSDGHASDEVLHWARVAMDSRRRWLHNRVNYDRMVKSLYDLMVQVSMERAIQIEQAYAADPSKANRERADAYKRQARYYLIVAAPCLHYGDCGPYFDVEVEGWAPCDDLVEMETLAKQGEASPEHMSCLKSKYRKSQAPKKRILTIMLTQANFDTDGKHWDELLAWHWNLTGLDTALLAYHYAEWLVNQESQDSEEALKWAQIALNQDGGLTGRSGRQALTRLHELRVATAMRLQEDAKIQYAEIKDAHHKLLLAGANATVQKVLADQKVYCAENPCK